MAILTSPLSFRSPTAYSPAATPPPAPEASPEAAPVAAPAGDVNATGGSEAGCESNLTLEAFTLGYCPDQISGRPRQTSSGDGNL